MTSRSFQSFKRAATAALQSLLPAQVTIDGSPIRAAVTLRPITVTLPDGGIIEHRALTALVKKTDLPNEPPQGITLNYLDQDYTVHSISGRADYEVTWTLAAMEKVRV